MANYISANEFKAINHIDKFSFAIFRKTELTTDNIYVVYYVNADGERLKYWNVNNSSEDDLPVIVILHPETRKVLAFCSPEISKRKINGEKVYDILAFVYNEQKGTYIAYPSFDMANFSEDFHIEKHIESSEKKPSIDIDYEVRKMVESENNKNPKSTFNWKKGIITAIIVLAIFSVALSNISKVAFASHDTAAGAGFEILILGIIALIVFAIIWAVINSSN